MQFAESMAVRAREHDRKLVDLPQLCGELSMCQSAARCGWSGYDCSRISRWGKPVRNALRTERSDDQRPVCSTTCWFANMDHRPQAGTPEGVVLYGGLVRSARVVTCGGGGAALLGMRAVASLSGL